ncbi:MAG: hypothetical protein M0D55_03295 [Elusimicrobiota bacterium]|nr:MAG: hypothetical protein M0D55_03295 [Elusimicrobiota bacterium]
MILLLAVAAAVGGGSAPVVDVVVARAGLWRVQAFRSGILLAVAFGDVLPEAWKLAPTHAGWGALAAFVFCYVAENLAPSTRAARRPRTATTIRSARPRSLGCSCTRSSTA